MLVEDVDLKQVRNSASVYQVHWHWFRLAYSSQSALPKVSRSFIKSRVVFMALLST